MTEKRFRVTIGNENDVRLVDYIDNTQLISISFKDYNDAVDCRDALLYQCNMMNELHDENQALKERRHEDINDLSVIAMKYKALEEENKELKEEIRMLNELLGERELAEYRRKEYDEFWARKKRIMGL